MAKQKNLTADSLFQLDRTFWEPLNDDKTPSSNSYNIQNISSTRDNKYQVKCHSTTSFPAKNKGVKPLTYRRLYNVTLYYLSRFDASSGKVRDMLKRRLLRTKMQGGEIPTDANDWIEQIIARMIELQYIDDKRFGENQVRLLSSQGKSTRFITMKLAAAGLDVDMIQEILETGTDHEMSRALRLVQRKKMGYLREESLRTEFYKKDLATLGRAGFSYETAVKALNGDAQED